MCEKGIFIGVRNLGGKPPLRIRQCNSNVPHPTTRQRHWICGISKQMNPILPFLHVYFFRKQEAMVGLVDIRRKRSGDAALTEERTK